MLNITKASNAEADKIIDTRAPLGLFYTISDGVYVGIDNRTGDAWVEDFKSLGTCKRWLVR